MVGVIWRETFRPIEEGMDPRLCQHRHAFDRSCKDRFEMIKVFRQLVELELVGNAGHSPGLGIWLKCAKQHLAGVFLVVGTLVRDTQDRQLPQAVDLLGHDVKVLASMQRNVDPCHPANLMPPHAAAIDHHLGFDKSGFTVLLPTDAGGSPVFDLYPGHFDPLQDLCAFLARSLCQSQCDVCRVALTIKRQVDSCGRATCVDMRIAVLDFAE
jgi:hypothetical protein